MHAGQGNKPRCNLALIRLHNTYQHADGPWGAQIQLGVCMQSNVAHQHKAQRAGCRSSLICYEQAFGSCSAKWTGTSKNGNEEERGESEWGVHSQVGKSKVQGGTHVIFRHPAMPFKGGAAACHGHHCSPSKLTKQPTRRVVHKDGAFPALHSKLFSGTACSRCCGLAVQQGGVGAKAPARLCCDTASQLTVREPARGAGASM